MTTINIKQGLQVPIYEIRQNLDVVKVHKAGLVVGNSGVGVGVKSVRLAFLSGKKHKIAIPVNYNKLTLRQKLDCIKNNIDRQGRYLNSKAYDEHKKLGFIHV